MIVSGSGRRPRTAVVCACLIGACIVALVVILVLIGGGWQQARETEPSGSDEDGVRADGAVSLEVSEPESGRLDEPGTRDYGREVIEPAGILFAGRVTNRKTGGPVREFVIGLASSERNKEGFDVTKEILSERIEDGDGRFSFRLDSGGERILKVAARGFLSYRNWDVYVPSEGGLADFGIELDPGLAVSGRVVEDRTGAPVAGAMVVPVDTDCPIFSGAEDDRRAKARTDEEGRFCVKGIKPGRERIKLLAVHADYAIGSAVAGEGEEDVEIRLVGGSHVFGVARDDQGNAIAGVRVHALGETNLLTRPVVTDEEGRYLTPPLNPGLIFVTATVRSARTDWWRDEEKGRFTEEHREVMLSDQDAQVDFGPAPDYVTWRGTLYDMGRRPLPNTIILICDGKNPTDYRPNQIMAVETDGDGYFGFCKLQPGCFLVSIRFVQMACETVLDRVTLDAPGIVDKDLFVAGGIIQGSVLNDLGEPLSGGRVVACQVYDRHRTVGTFGDVSCPVLEKGSFRLIGLRPGQYSLSYRGGFGGSYDYPGLDNPWNDVYFELAEEDLLDGVQLVVPQRGRFCLRGTGFTIADKDRFQLELGRGDADRSEDNAVNVRGLVNRRGNLDYSTTLRVGTWNARITCENGGSIERTFQVVANRVTGMVIDRTEFVQGEGCLVVKGVVEGENGTPLPGRTIRLQNVDTEDVDTDERRCTSGLRGEFECLLSAGQWSVVVEGATDATASKGCGTTILKPIDIPEGASSPYVVRLVLPSGHVLCRIDTPRLPESSVSQSLVWSAYLLESETEKEVASVHAIKGTETALSDLSAGNYRLRVEVEGCLPWLSDVFSVRDGETRDIRCAPIAAGLLRMELFDCTGAAVDGEVTVLPTGGCATQRLFPQRKGEGRVECLFPVGSCTAVVRVEGFKDAAIAANLEQNEVKEMRVILQNR